MKQYNALLEKLKQKVLRQEPIIGAGAGTVLFPRAVKRQAVWI